MTQQKYSPIGPEKISKKGRTAQNMQFGLWNTADYSSASAFFRFFAIWSGQLVGRGPQVVPSIRSMASSAFMPFSRRLMPYR